MVARCLMRNPGVYFCIMPKMLKVEQHLSTEELQERYRGAEDPVGRSHYQIVWLLSQGKGTAQVAEATGYSTAWIREVAKRYNEADPAKQEEFRGNSLSG